MPTIKIKERAPAEPRPEPAGAQFAWGRRPGSGPDEADGARVGGHRLVRDPLTGMLVNVPDPGDAA